MSWDKCARCNKEKPPLSLFRFDKDIYKKIIIQPYDIEVESYETIKVKGKNGKTRNKKVIKKEIVTITPTGFLVSNNWHEKFLCQGCKNEILEEIEEDYSKRTGVKMK